MTIKVTVPGPQGPVAQVFEGSHYEFEEGGMLSVKDENDCRMATFAPGCWMQVTAHEK